MRELAGLQTSSLQEQGSALCFKVAAGFETLRLLQGLRPCSTRDVSNPAVDAPAGVDAPAEADETAG